MWQFHLGHRSCCDFASGASQTPIVEFLGGTIDAHHYRDLLLAASNAALADTEGFGEICFALEALRLRAHGKQEALGLYRKKIFDYARWALVLTVLPQSEPSSFK